MKTGIAISRNLSKPTTTAYPRRKSRKGGQLVKVHVLPQIAGIVAVYHNRAEVFLPDFFKAAYVMGIEVVVQFQIYLKLSELHPFHTFRPHPFKVRDDAKMQETVESIKLNGVMVPGLARPEKDGNGYEIVAAIGAVAAVSW